MVKSNLELAPFKKETPKKNIVNVGAINVPLAVLWSEPGKKRDHDDLILGETTDPDAWADGMDDEMRLWLVGKVETQALFGERVIILKRTGKWMKVAAVSQRTHKNSQGYPGWVPSIQVSTDSVYLSEQLSKPKIVVAVPKASLYTKEDFNESNCPLSYQTRLPLLEEKTNSFLVRLPNGSTGYLRKEHVKKEENLYFSGNSVIEQASQFLGLRYMWGGTSAWGFDCSGLTFRTYQSQGVSIPRDSGDQAQEGIPIDKKDLLPGDLVFFADNDGQGKIYHVGINIGNDIMIHSSNSRSFVKEEAFNIGLYASNYWGARRY